MNFKEKALKIKAIILDIDGVLTDGRIGYSHDNNELKFFDVKDGLGISLALRAGFKVGVLSGRKAKANRIRSQELGLSFFYEGEKNKLEGFEKILIEYNLKEYECMYIGDDLIDIPVLKRVGISIATKDAIKELDEICDFRTSSCGGRGAVREAIVWLLKETAKWDSLVQKYFE